MTKDAEIVKRETVPGYLQRQDKNAPAAGTENIGREDMTLPRLGLCQSNSPQKVKSDPKYIKGLEEGQFFNTITQEIYGDEVNLVPLMFYKGRMFFNPMEEGGGIRCRADDAQWGVGDPGGECRKCPFSQFQGSKAPACDQLMNYPVLVIPKEKNRSIGLDALAVFSLKSTGIKVSKEWNAVVRLSGLDMFARIYKVKSVSMSKDKYHWQGILPIMAVSNVPETIYREAQAFYASVQEMKAAGVLRHDVSDMEHNDSPAEV